jgi:hypothetical protein
MTYQALYNDNTLSCFLPDRETALEFARNVSGKVKYVVCLVGIPKTNEHETLIQVPGSHVAGVPADPSLSESYPLPAVCTPGFQPQYHPQGYAGNGEGGPQGEGRRASAGLADVHGFTGING